MANWTKVGSIRKGDKGKYIKIDNDISLKKGQNLQIFDPRKSKFIDEEKLAKIPEYILFDLFLAPPKTQ